jgi:hypothetical protein
MDSMTVFFKKLSRFIAPKRKAIGFGNANLSFGCSLIPILLKGASFRGFKRTLIEKTLNGKILSLARELEPDTINRILEKEDPESVVKDFLQQCSDNPEAFGEILEEMMETLQGITAVGKQYQDIKRILADVFARFMPVVPVSAEIACGHRLGAKPVQFLNVALRAMLADYCLFYGSGERDNPLITKFVDEHASQLSGEEISILRDFEVAEFGVLEVKASLVESGMVVYDLLNDEPMVIFDEGLSESIKPGMLIISHIVESSDVFFATDGAIAADPETRCARLIRSEILNMKEAEEFHDQEAYCRRILQIVYQNIEECGK